MKYPLKNILKNFLNHVEDLEARRRLNDDQYEVEFQKLKHLTDTLKWDPESSSTHGQKEVNRMKNRYKDIVPYDFCRVILPECAGIPGSDYINASHVKGASGAFAYIAAQGPLPNTVIDFWRMIWVCDVQVVVMACNEREGGKTKCESYWPEAGETKQFGTLSIEFVSQTQVCLAFLVRVLLVRNDNETRKIWQFHYTSWPDHGIPDAVQPILELVRLVRDCQASETAPILVHCSAGCGRTGTICAIDFIWACLRTGKLTENFCLYDIVAEMRRQRIAMVQTKEQYILVHRAVSAMFEQQLNLIDSHTYENLDKDGSPLTWASSLNENGSSSFATSGELNLQQAISERNESLLEDLTEQLKKQLMEKAESHRGNHRLVESTKCLMLSENNVQYNSQQHSEMSGALSEGELYNFSEDSAVQINRRSSKDAPFDSSSSALLLSSPESADSIPFIDDDETKSEIQVRARCGRAYLHIPSCDSISKIVDRFDPFVDKIWAGIDGSCPETDDHYHSLPASVAGQLSNSENSSIISTFDQINAKSSDVWLKSEESSLCPKDLKREVFDSLSISSGNKNINSIQSVDGSVQVDTQKCGPSGSEGSSNKKVIDNEKGFSRRPSIVRLKGFFDRSSKCKSNGKTSLFRNHSHHVSRAGSAPPSLSSMKQSSDKEKESLFSMVTRKFRSSSVKSEQELKKENCSSHVATLKRTAMTSFSNLKQNISNISRNMAFSAHRTPTKPTEVVQSVSFDYQRSPQSSISMDNDNKMNDLDSNQLKSNEKQPDFRKDAPTYNFDTKTQKVEKLPPSFNYSDGREDIQQKFVVNVLSSSHGQNVLKVGKTSVFPPLPDRNNSPKSKHFMADFECLKANPIRLLTRNVNSKPNTAESSSFWYGYQEENVNSTEQNVTSTLTKDKKNKKQVGPTESLNPWKIATSAKSSTSDSQSIFYTGNDERDKATHSDSPIDLIQPEKIGASSFFWPRNDFSEKTNTVDINTSLPVQTASHKIAEPKLDSRRKSLKNEEAILNNNMKLLPENDVPSISNNFKESKLQYVASESSHILLLEQPIGNKSEDPLTLSTKENVKHDAQCESVIEPVNGLTPMVLEPPALPRKTVIGKNKGVHIATSKDAHPVIQSDFVSIQPIGGNHEDVDKSLVPQEIHLVSNVKTAIEDNPQESLTPAGGKTDLYINVNIVTKKNLEQIESTLRNHPRGAIIDLTSRQSYSMEEELTTAVQKLPEPVQLQNIPASIIAAKNAGYEVIWPENSKATSQYKKESSENSSHEKNIAEVKFGIAPIINKDLSNSMKKSGLCYSPPLRRSVMPNFPVLKSRSCASLDWLLHDRIDEALKVKQEMPMDTPNRNETLVNEAVVELSTLLDELTTKTLSDDLTLESPKPINKLLPPIDNLPLIPKESNSSHENSPNINRKRLNSPHKYETIYLPQKQALSIKNKDDEEIIFHFPPPPRMPPPPASQDSVMESFNLLCKKGKLHFCNSSKTDMSVNTDIDVNKIDYKCENTLQDKEISCNVSIPIPIPRKTKQISTVASNSLRKSASYTTLIIQANSIVEQNLDTLERPQTLPRPQAVDSSQKVSSFSSSLSSGDDDVTENTNRTNAYERIFPDAYESNIKTSETNSLLETDVKSMHTGQNARRSPTTFSDLREADLQNFDVVKSFRKHPEIDLLVNPTPDKSEEVSKYSVLLPSNSQNQQKVSNTFEIPTDPVIVSPIYGKVNKLQGPTTTPEKNSQLERQENHCKKSLIPSRKLEKAPVPPSLKYHTELDTGKQNPSLEASLQRNRRKASSRKTERAPGPPPLQKSESFSVCSSTRSSEQAVPAYAAIQKHKLPSVFENISYPQSTSKSSNLRKLDSLYDEQNSNRSHQRVYGKGLQHSQSDASIYIALQGKYKGKIEMKNKEPLSAVRKVSDSSSESDGSYRHLNISDEQKLQKNILKQKPSSMPVAPPRSRRRSTVEIHYVRDIIGAAKARTLPREECNEPCDSLPNVPAKTKEAFEIPEEFRAASHSQTHSVRSIPVKERRKDPSSFHHL